jgi:glycosyltransferase involved in cell wall biosynthesis
LGAKRNDLIARARGEIIAQFDDDDYYAPKYLSTMVGALRERGADFVKLSGWFLLGAIDGSFGYWNTEVRTGLRFRCDGREAKPVMLSEEDGTAFSSENGFGFSYVFKRELWEKTKFRDVNFAEDGHFQREAIEGRSMMYVVDQGGICLHILHGKNTACCFPQYLLPPFMVRVLFPGAGNYLNAMMGDRGK